MKETPWISLSALEFVQKEQAEREQKQQKQLEYVAQLEKALLGYYHAADFFHWNHGEDCRRRDECDDIDAKNPCIAHDADIGCPGCECGVTDLRAAEALAKPVAEEAMRRSKAP